MAKYAVNDSGLARARELIAAGQYVLESEWTDIQPSADDQNAYLVRRKRLPLDAVEANRIIGLE